MLINKAVKRRVVTEPMFVSETVDRCDPETLLQPQQSAGGGGEGCGEEALAMGRQVYSCFSVVFLKTMRTV